MLILDLFDRNIRELSDGATPTNMPSGPIVERWEFVAVLDQRPKMDFNTQLAWELCVVNHGLASVAGDAGSVARLLISCRQLLFPLRLASELRSIHYAWKTYTDELAHRALYDYEWDLVVRDLARDEEEEGYATD